VTKLDSVGEVLKNLGNEDIAAPLIRRQWFLLKTKGFWGGDRGTDKAQKQESGNANIAKAWKSEASSF